MSEETKEELTSCPYCGGRISAKAFICGNCGTRLKEKTTEERTAKMPEAKEGKVAAKAGKLFGRLGKKAIATPKSEESAARQAGYIREAYKEMAKEDIRRAIGLGKKKSKKEAYAEAAARGVKKADEEFGVLSKEELENLSYGVLLHLRNKVDGDMKKAVDFGLKNLGHIKKLRFSLPEDQMEELSQLIMEDMKTKIKKIKKSGRKIGEELKILTSKYCMYCGGGVKPADVFCMYCGARVYKKTT